MRKSETAWTVRQDTVLRQMKAAGLPHVDISDRLGRSRSAIEARWKLIQDLPADKLSEVDQRLASNVRKRRSDGENRPNSASAGSDTGSLSRPAIVPAESLDCS